MSRRRINLRTTRKGRPTSDCNLLSFTSNMKNNRFQKTTKKKSNSNIKLSKNIKPDHEVTETPLVDEVVKPRRRRLDVSDYIRRRFLYDDTGNNLAETRSIKAQECRISHVAPFRSSPHALMVASSANLHNKIKCLQNKTSYRSHRCCRGRKSQLAVLNLVNRTKSLENLSSVNDGSSADGHTSDECCDQVTAGYTDRHLEVEHDEHSHLLKSFFIKTQKKGSYKLDADFTADTLQSHPDYASEIPALYLNDEMNEFTRSRGPVVLSKRARHRLVPRPSPPMNDFIKQVSNYPGRESGEFGSPDTDEAFQVQVPGPFSLSEVVPLNEADREASAGWSCHMEESVDPSSINLTKHSGVEIEDFAGDLLPQSSAAANCPPASGSGRRKSPIRPMQVLRSEPILYHSENCDSIGFDPTGTSLIQQNQLSSSLSQTPGSETVAAGLFDLCTAAGLDSTAQSLPRLSHITTECSESVKQRPQSIVSNVPQYSLINSNSVSFQQGGRMFVGACARTPIAGYTVAPSTPVSRIALTTSRYNYGQAHSHSKIPHSNTCIKASSIGTVSSNSSTRRRPAILKRGVAPAPSSINPVSKISTAYNVPRLSPPFMRTALRSVQASSLTSVHQSSRPVAYTIVSAAASGQPNVITVTPASCTFDSSSPQTASSRLFGSKRNAAGVYSSSESRSLVPLSSNSNLTLISCLPAPSVGSSAHRSSN